MIEEQKKELFTLKKDLEASVLSCTETKEKLSEAEESLTRSRAAAAEAAAKREELEVGVKDKEKQDKVRIIPCYTFD